MPAKRKGAGKAGSAGCLAKFAEFKENVRGWVDMKYMDFRDKIVPLPRKAQWSDGERAAVAAIVDAGGGYALSRLGMTTGAAAEEWERVLKPRAHAWASTSPELSKADLETRLRALAASCQKDSWPPERFLAFVAYMDSGRGLETLKDAAQPPTESKQSGGAAAPAPAAAAAALVPAEQDMFTEIYRRAAPAYKAFVSEFLRKCALFAGRT